MFFRLPVYKRIKSVSILKKNELNKLILKSLLMDSSFLNIYRFYFNFKLNSYSKHSSISTFRRSCTLSNYPRSVIRFFKLSRHTAKSYASDGYLMGMRKSSF